MKKLLAGLVISFICNQTTLCATSSKMKFVIHNYQAKIAKQKPKVTQEKWVEDKIEEKKPKDFNSYVSFLKEQAYKAGVSKQFLATQNNILFIDKAVELDKKQSKHKRKKTKNVEPNPKGITYYLNRVLTINKVNKATKLWWEYQPELTKASKQYGVPKEYLMALWGMESGFGYYQGSYDVLSVLATLAFDGRREKLFQREFINAMKILEKRTISRDAMKGSWAGAMGQSQFMPTSYLKFATDGNNDGKKDIWNDSYDVFASIANYLATVGWNKEIPWGIEVKLTYPLSLAKSGTQFNKARSLSDWKRLGIKVLNSNYSKIAKLKKIKLWLVLPNKLGGRAFLVSNNYRTLKHWNNSNYFAVSIGKFAEKIAQNVY